MAMNDTNDIISGFIGALLGMVSVLYIAPESDFNLAELLRKISYALIPVLYGLISGYIVDTFIEEESL